MKSPAKKWIESETKLAMSLYYQLPFGQLHKGNPEIIKLADFLGRSPSSVAMKLANFASLDPKVTETGRKGLVGASKLDKEVWQTFTQDWTSQAIEAEQAWDEIVRESNASRVNELPVPFYSPVAEGTSSVEAIVQRRLGQNFFRRSVLANFENRCCVTGVAQTQLLNASHIIPWNSDVDQRHNPANGLSLIATLDRAFDRGFLTFDQMLRLKLSPILSAHSDSDTRNYFSQYQGVKMRAASRFDPSSECMAWHREHVFRAG